MRLFFGFILISCLPAFAAVLSPLQAQKLLVALQNHDSESAVKVISDSAYNKTRQEALIKEINSLEKTKRLILESFRSSEGKVETVEMLTGMRQVEILGVGSEGVAARVKEDGRETLFIFSGNDLSDRERYKRLLRSGGDDRLVKLGCGLLALNAGKLEVGIDCLETSGSLIGRILLNHVKETGGEVTITPEPEELKTMTEEAFAEVLAKLKQANPQQVEWDVDFRTSREQVYLYLTNHKEIQDISPLRGYNIYSLSLRNTNVEDLAPILNDGLKRLDIRGCPIASLDALRNMRLDHLGTLILDPIEILHGLNLKSLDVAGSSVTNLDFLKDMTLTELNISSCKIRDISELRHLKDSLTSLTFTPLGFNHLQFIRQMKALNSLRMYKGKVNSLEPLRKLRLENLFVSGQDMSVGGLDCLVEMPLKKLYLDCDGVRDPRQLLRIKSLETLGLPIGISGLNVLRKHPSLRKIVLIKPGEPNEWQDIEAFWKMIDAAQ